jgi:hypothetical protein
MFTLKIASYDATGPGGHPLTEMWFADVARVSRIWTRPAGEAWASLDEANGYGDPYQANNFTRFDETNPDLLVTLLWVVYGSGGKNEYMLVERAFLLAPNGDTIERICP